MVPQDPMILLSWLNTKLRDGYGGLDELCEDLELEREKLEQKLGALGFCYDPEQNRFL